MGLETGTFISDLNANNPVGASDPKSEGDDHIRLLKSTILNTFPNITGAVNASHTELNLLDGATGVTGTGNTVRSASPTFTTLIASGTITANLFSGSGASLSSLNASQLGSGIVPDARFPALLPAISGINLTSLNASVLTSGIVPDARFPATLPALNGSNLTNLNAGALASGIVPTARLPVASEIATGIIEQATIAEATAGIDTTRAITAAGMQAKFDLGTFAQQVLFTGSVSKNDFTNGGTTNDWAPSGHADAYMFRVGSAGASGHTLTGLAGGIDGRVIVFKHIVGTDSMTLAAQSASSVASNRFDIGGTIANGGTIGYRYSNVTNRWERIFT